MKPIGKIEAAGLVVKGWIHAYRLKSPAGSLQKKVKLADAAIPHFSRMFKALSGEKQAEIAHYASEQLSATTRFGLQSVAHRGFLQALRFGRFTWGGGVDERLFSVLGSVGKKIVREFIAKQ